MMNNPADGGFPPVFPQCSRRLQHQALHIEACTLLFELYFKPQLLVHFAQSLVVFLNVLRELFE